MLIPVLTLAMLQTPAIPQGQHGYNLYSDCLAAIRFLDGPPESRTDAAAANSNSCASYVGGFLAALEFFPNQQYTCLHTTMVDTVIRVYISYMKKNPKEMDDYKPLSLMDALADAYPCPAKK